MIESPLVKAKLKSFLEARPAALRLAGIVIVVAICGLLPSIYLSWRSAPNETAAAVSDFDEAGPSWQKIQNSTNVADLWNFVLRFGASPYASEARSRLEQMNPSDWSAISDKIVSDIIYMESCRAAWNQRLDNMDNAGSNENIDFSGSKIDEPEGETYALGKVYGLKYSYRSTALDGDVCGWYFIPNAGAQLSALSALAQKISLSRSMDRFIKASSIVVQLIGPEGVESSRVDEKAHQSSKEANDDILDARRFYNEAVNDEFARIQGVTPTIYLDSMPITSSPTLFIHKELSGFDAFKSTMLSKNKSVSVKLRKRVADDLYNLGAD
jgi:hypothetical protein